MILTTPRLMNKTSFSFDSNTLSTMDCGLFRMNMKEAIDNYPYYKELLESAPVKSPEEWEVDIKVHMLMPGQFPCIPNWHCDNIPRVDGELQYSQVSKDTPKMLLWLSGGPYTEFLTQEADVDTPKTHQELSSLVEDYKTFKIPSNRWIELDQHTPHRGTSAQYDTWRVFVRLTHKSISPSREVVSTTRRHCQVYLDKDAFGW